MKKFVLILFAFLSWSKAFTQTDTNQLQSADSQVQISPTVLPKPVKRKPVADTLHTKRIAGNAQVIDSLKKDSATSTVSDTVHTKFTVDTIKAAVKPVIVLKPFDSFYQKMLDNPFLRTKSKPIFLLIRERQRTSKDEMFYLVLALLLFLAFIKLAFSKYFNNIFRLFFQPSFRQKQTREQLQQGNLPSLLLNLFFIISAAAYISFLVNYYHLIPIGFWWLLLYSALTLLVLYTGKYVFLSFAGWVFNVKEATDAYIFATYLINKILGVVLVPFTLIIAFSATGIINISIAISILLILLLFLYRYFVSFGSLYREVKVSPLHFLFYVLAFEIIPLLLIYKTLMLYMNNSL